MKIEVESRNEYKKFNLHDFLKFMFNLLINTFTFLQMISIRNVI